MASPIRSTRSPTQRQTLLLASAVKQVNACSCNARGLRHPPSVLAASLLLGPWFINIKTLGLPWPSGGILSSLVAAMPFARSLGRRSQHSTSAAVPSRTRGPVVLGECRCSIHAVLTAGADHRSYRQLPTKVLRASGVSRTPCGSSGCRLCKGVGVVAAHAASLAEDAVHTSC